MTAIEELLAQLVSASDVVTDPAVSATFESRSRSGLQGSAGGPKSSGRHDDDTVVLAAGLYVARRARPALHRVRSVGSVESTEVVSGGVAVMVHHA
jgi:hypothetical protein